MKRSYFLPILAPLFVLTTSSLYWKYSAAYSHPEILRDVLAEQSSELNGYSAKQVVESLRKSADPSSIQAVQERQPAKHDPQALRRLLDAVEAMSHRRQKPLVLFDLDDTLLDTAGRNARILREFAAEPVIRQRFPAETAKIISPAKSLMRWNIPGTLSNYGITDESFIAEAQKFWGQRFFRNDYIPEDDANPGAVDFVETVLSKGGIVVYFTGRWEEMRPGTEQGLKRNGLPLPDGKNVLLWMKPSKDIKDDVFKNAKLAETAAFGVVIGGFENEPKNINVFQENFPEGIMVFVDTKHSNPKDAAGRSIEPYPSVFWVKDFRIP